MANPSMMSTESSDVPVETLAELDRSFALERMVKALLFFAVFIAYALLGQKAHPFIAIVMFVLLADIMSLNRQRKLVATLRAAERATPPATDAAYERDAAYEHDGAE